ncbi:hypothetical protein EVAR_10370_1 [Eumeta japonica]|uniref:Uncharacterized protein n=1 Tax=Eumeta variegata TaxID=151549 RepID=A0A4C1UDE5_EUMVA|nr:hypothetical protein EVAR_10370_1 [Eumeta japonica]
MSIYYALAGWSGNRERRDERTKRKREKKKVRSRIKIPISSKPAVRNFVPKKHMITAASKSCWIYQGYVSTTKVQGCNIPETGRRGRSRRRGTLGKRNAEANLQVASTYLFFLTEIESESRPAARRTFYNRARVWARELIAYLTLSLLLRVAFIPVVFVLAGGRWPLAGYRFLQNVHSENLPSVGFC